MSPEQPSLSPHESEKSLPGISQYLAERISTLDSIVGNMQEDGKGPVFRHQDDKGEMLFINPYQTERDRLAQIQTEMRNGSYFGLINHFNQEIEIKQGEIDTTLQRLRPRGDMDQDYVYFQARGEITEAQHLMRDGVSDSVKTWMEKQIRRLQDTASETERGRLMADVNSYNRKKTRLMDLRAQIPIYTEPPQQTPK